MPKARKISSGEESYEVSQPKRGKNLNVNSSLHPNPNSSTNINNAPKRVSMAQKNDYKFGERIIQKYEAIKFDKTVDEVFGNLIEKAKAKLRNAT